MRISQPLCSCIMFIVDILAGLAISILILYVKGDLIVGKIVDEVLIKGAYITKHQNRFKADAGVNSDEYWLHLTHKQFNMFCDMGVKAKMLHSKFTDEDVYFVNVRCKDIEEDTFLERNDIDIKFSVYAISYHDQEIKVLYFNRKGIRKKGE